MEMLSSDPTSNELMECVVTLKSLELLESFYDDMETPGGDLYIPNRQVSVYMRRPMSVNTHYMLSAEEINSLRLDPRVVAVNPANLIRQSKKLTRILTGVTNSGSNYDKRGYPTAIDSLSTNWALLRCTLGTQISNWGDDNATGGLVNTGAYSIANTTTSVTNPGNKISSSFISALSFAGTANQWLKCVSPSMNVALGTSNWCMECWFRQTATKARYSQIIGLRATNGSPTYVGQYAPISIGTQSGKLLVASSSTGTGWNISSPDIYQIPETIVNAQWYHVAAVRNGNLLDIYLNGVSVLRKNVTGVNYTQTPLPFMIGGSDFLSEDPFKGQITNVRVTRSTPVYTNNFTVPTSPLNTITGTVLLIKEAIADVSGISSTITNHNNVTLITVTPGPFGDNGTPPAPPPPPPPYYPPAPPPTPPYYPPAPPPPPAPASGIKPVRIEPTGQHVDVIIVDGMSGVPDHPEFARVRDGTGGSRYVQFDWHQLNTIAASLDDDSATLLTGSYSYAKATNAHNANHGSHTAGSVAGNSQGWAVDANIYQIDPVSGTIDSLIIWDYIRAFHNSKPINPATGLRNPTICNCSYGSSLTHSTSAIGGIGPIIEGTRRGSKIGVWTENTPLTRTQLTNLGIYASSNGTATIPILWDDEAADVQQAIADGIIVVGAAGNESQYIDKVGGLDYNNSYYFRYTGGASPVAFLLNYHRGTSPGAAVGAICVGSVDANRTERKAYYSNTGPRLDVFAPGTWIISSVSDISGEGYGTSVDARSNSYFIGKSIGTSMAAPQVTGVLACVLQRYPRMSPTKALKYITYHSKTNQMSSPTVGTSPTWVTNQYHLQGANNRYLFMPYERPLTGMVYPKKNYWIRLDNESGRVYPRPKKYVRV